MTGSEFHCKYMFAVLFISRIFVSFTFLGSAWTAVTTGDVLASLLLLFVFLLVSTLPILFYIRSANGVGILERAKALSPGYAKLLALFYIAAYFALCFATEVRFQLFVSSIVLPDTSPFLFMLVILATACYGAYKGLKTTSRAGFIVACLLGFMILLITITLYMHIDLSNLTPLFYDGVKKPFQTCIYSLCATMELSVVPVLLSEVKGKIVKNFYIWLTVLCAAIFLLIFLTTAVLGAFSNSRMFPVYAVVVQSDLGIFQRIDVILSGVWTLCILIKLCFFIRLIVFCVEKGFGVKKSTPGIFLIGSLLLIAIVVVSRNILLMSQVFQIPIFLGMFLLATVVIPLSVPLLEKRKNKRSRIYKPAALSEGRDVI